MIRFLNNIFKKNIFIKMSEIVKTQPITEGKATITTGGKVFYNPVQEFNRDLSISVLNTFIKLRETEKQSTKKSAVEDIAENDDGIVILEALSATGLRSIRYAKEVSGVKQVIANDFSVKAVDDIKKNIEENKVEKLVTASFSDATILMYQHKKHNRFDVIDLDPYGCPAIFLDSAVQAINDGGLLLVTATDMSVLAGNSPETCYSKYGAISLRMKSCHEMALRILLQCIESHANRYGRYIDPLLSISADFYIRVFVRVYSGPNKCKLTTSKLSYVEHCTDCDSFSLQPLGVIKTNAKTGNVKYGLPNMSNLKSTCEHCQHSLHMGGPIWSAPIHEPLFVQKVLDDLVVVPGNKKQLGTCKRIEGVLGVVMEELDDVPLYYTLDRLAATLHAQTPPMLLLRSALLYAGYRVSSTHCNKVGIKCSGGASALWSAMRAWVATHPVHPRHTQTDSNSVASRILSARGTLDGEPYRFEMHPEANPASRRNGSVRFQANPTAFWGPGTRATAMVGDGKLPKKERNQGKRKREKSPLVQAEIKHSE